MNLFFLKALLRGELFTTAKFEKKIEALSKNAKRYHQLKDLDTFQEYLQLEKVVNSAEFKAKKTLITRAKFKDSDEAKKLAQLAQLSKDSIVRKYNKTGEGEDHPKVIRYKELEALTKTVEFQTQVAFWKDANRWATTAEGKQEARFQELAKDPDIMFLRNANHKEIDMHDKFALIWQDDFLWTNLKESDWKPGFAYPEHFKAVHSYANEQQAFVGGRNVETQDSKLFIHTKKEDCEAPAWDEKKGMVMLPFHYTSDVIQMDKIAIEQGMTVQAKVRCHGFLNHGIYLRSKNHIPYISVFDYTGLKLYCGLKDSIQSNKNLKVLDGLQPITDTVFTVSWQEDEIVWFVNNLEVYRTKNTIKKGEKLYLHCYSFQFENTRITEGKLEVDWIRIFRNK